MTTQGMARFEGYAPPGRGAVDRILSSADRQRAEHLAVAEIRDLINSLDKPHALVPARRIRRILKKHRVL